MNTEKNKKKLQIIVSTILFTVAYVIDKKTNLTMTQNLCMYLVPYLAAGFDILREAAEKIFKGELFDEDFLMSIATIGALFLCFFIKLENYLKSLQKVIQKEQLKI